MSLFTKDKNGNLVIMSIRYYMNRPEHCKIKCDYINCYCGMGLAGNGNCHAHKFSTGMWWSNNCPVFESKDDVIKGSENYHFKLARKIISQWANWKKKIAAM